MRVLKKILFIVVIIFAALLILALILPRQYSVQRNVVINQPKAVVFEFVKFLENQDYYSSWANLDPEMKKEYRGEDGMVGFISAWDSKVPDVGRGEQEITGILEGERIDFELRFFEPFQSTDHAYIITKSVNDSTTSVTWGFEGIMPYPMNLMLPFMKMEEMLGKDLQDGLDKLKIILEEKKE